MKHAKISIFVLLTALLATTALVISPARMAYAQGNETGALGNATAALDADGMIASLKAKHAALSALAEGEDRELLSKIKDMDAKEAAKTALALNIIRSLQEYKAVEETP